MDTAALHWVEKGDRRAELSDLVGGKAAGLARLPSSWTPGFVVLTTHGVGASERRHRLSFPSSQKAALPRLLRSSPDGVLVRSSAAREDLHARGMLETRRCEPSITAVAETVAALSGRAERPTDGSSDSPPGEVAYLIQRYHQAHALGHMSNERRVDRDRRVWLCEVEADVAPEERAFRIKTDKRRKLATSLECADADALDLVLRLVATRLGRLQSRFHLEWVWDGTRVWIVQADPEPDLPGGRNPGDIPKKFASRPSRRQRTLVFRSLPRKKTEWSKVEDIRTFRKAGVPTADFYVLAGDPVAELYGGRVSDQLRADLEALTSAPLVIRSDVDVPDAAERLLSPRSDACASPRAAVDFLLEAAASFRGRRYPSERVVFLAHHFIPARSGAFALARPDEPVVRIDATWGFPDSLLYYPHDSFEVDSETEEVVSSKLRCKDHYMALGSDGSWAPVAAGHRYDWRPSLSSRELGEIARRSADLATRLRTAVEVMFFVGIRGSDNLPDLIPWYLSTDSPRLDDVEPASTYYIGERFVVNEPDDLARLQADLVRRPSRQKQLALRLRPQFAFLRDRGFVRRVAAVARQWDLPVELEGSILSHAFYVLNRAGARVRAVDLLPSAERRQRFGKLVRDMIPVRIERRGELPTVYRAPRRELVPLLREKLLEEAFEFFWERREAAAIEELGDIYELIRAWCRTHDQDISVVVEASERKRAERGGFEEGVVLVETRRRYSWERDSDETSPRLFRDRTQEPTARSTRSFAGRRRPIKTGARLSLPLVPPMDFRLGVSRLIGGEDDPIEVTYQTDIALVQLEAAREAPREQLTLELDD